LANSTPPDFGQHGATSDAAKRMECDEPDLSPLYEANCATVRAVAAGAGRVALDFENTPREVSAEAATAVLATLGVHQGGARYVVVIEPYPWPTLQAVLAQRCTVLTWGDSEGAWLTTLPGPIPTALATVQDLQASNRRDCEFLVKRLEMDDHGDSFWQHDQLDRNIAEAFALRRHPSVPLFLKMPGNTFHYPDGVAEPSIWTKRPLRRTHVDYAAADVVALFTILGETDFSG
jgi:hypothetical protein